MFITALVSQHLMAPYVPSTVVASLHQAATAAWSSEEPDMAYPATELIASAYVVPLPQNMFVVVETPDISQQRTLEKIVAQ